MIFTILTAVVFIAELIIANTLISKLRKIDNAICTMSATVTELKPSIKAVGSLVKNISAQYVEFAYDFVLMVKSSCPNCGLPIRPLPVSGRNTPATP